jgi:SAM-dependent methyltransferase
LVELLASGLVAKGKAYDLGCGPGNDAAHLAGQGWDVTAVDIAPAAVTLAQETAQRAGIREHLRFKVADVLALEADGEATLVLDRGCFHTLPEDLRGRYRDTVDALLAPGGILALKVFSHSMPGTEGPCRFSPKDIDALFCERFELLAVKEGYFEGPVRSLSLFCVLKKNLD